MPTLLNMTSATLISKTETYVVAIKIAILLLVITMGFTDIDLSRMAPVNWEPLGSIIGGGMLIFVAYEGFELIANAAPSIKDKATTLPRAYYASVIFVTLLYILISMVTIGALSPEKIAQASDFALAEAAKPSLGPWGFKLVAVSAILATFSAINATLYGSSRLSYTIAEENELPAFLKKKVWNKPIVGLLLTAGFSLILANTIDLSSISTMGSAGFLIIFASVNAANFKKSKEINSSRIVAATGVIACVMALLSLIVYTFKSAPLQLFFLAGMIGISLLVEAAVIRAHHQHLG